MEEKEHGWGMGGGGRGGKRGLSALHNLLSKSWWTQPPANIPLLVQLETKTELTLTFFLCTGSHVISSNPSPPSSTHPSIHPAACSPTPQSRHRESRLYESLLSSPNLGVAERPELASLQLHTDPRSLARLCPEKSLLLVTTTTTARQPDEPPPPHHLLYSSLLTTLNPARTY